MVVEPVQRRGPVEQLGRQTGGVFRVGRVGVELLRQAAQIRRPQPAQLAAGVDGEPIEQHALAQRVLRDRHLLDRERTEDLVEQDRAGDDDVDPLLVEAGHRQPLVGRLRRQLVDQVAQLGRRERRAVELAGFVAAAGERHGRQRRRRSGTADRDLRLVAAQLVRHGRERRAHVRPALLDRLSADGSVVVGIGHVAEEPLGQPDRAELHAARLDDLVALAHAELGAPTADVDDQHPPIEHRQRLQHAEVDEARLLEPGDHLDVDADLVTHPIEEHLPVAGLTNGTRGDGRHLDDAEAARHRPHARASDATPRSIASGASCFISPPP